MIGVLSSTARALESQRNLKRPETPSGTTGTDNQIIHEICELLNH